MPWRRCPGPGFGHPRCGQLTQDQRCPRCTPIHATERTHAARAVRPYSTEERKARAAAVAKHRAKHGDNCPGWQCDPHPITSWSGPLTADHPVAVAAGGSEVQVYAVMCRSCNSRKGTQPE